MCHYLWLIKSTRWPPDWNAPGAGLSNRRFLHGLPWRRSVIA
uniref:Uncharacterized protein n=1 Tax=Escherichia coli TaxID=562 RepID=Q8KQG3_ECOLX|nr:unknown [Escherichia coli]